MTSGEVSRHDLRRAMGRFVTGVTVVASGRSDPHGMTLNALTSVSLDPPQVLICIATKSRMAATVQDDHRFTVSVLSAELLDAARYFASPARVYGADGFAAFDTVSGPTLGHPIFADCVTWLECHVAHTRTAGDHTVFTGTVVDCGQGTGTTPLLFSDGVLMAHERAEQPHGVA